MFYLHPVQFESAFLEQKFNFESNREYVKMLWNYLVPNVSYICICRNDNFIALNRLSLKYQNAFDIINNFILEENNNFVLLKEFFKKNALFYRYIYSHLFPKYFCGIDNYAVKRRWLLKLLMLDITTNKKVYVLGSYLLSNKKKTETDETVEVVHHHHIHHQNQLYKNQKKER